MVSPAVEKSGEVSSRAIRNPSHGLARGDCHRRTRVRDGQPRGANVPRSWLCMRLCIAKVAFCGTVRAFKQERRASPPWCAETHLQWRRKPRETADVVLTRIAAARSCVARYVMGFRASHGGLTPPALVLHESASAGDLRFPARALPNHGGLTPPALVWHEREFGGCVSEMSQVPSRRTASVVSHCRACSAEITFVAFVYQENGVRGEPLPGVFRRNYVRRICVPRKRRSR
jgi:hypothetical protein